MFYIVAVPTFALGSAHITHHGKKVRDISYHPFIVQVMVLSQDRDRGRMSLSTKKLEPLPGDMLRDPQKVYDQADEMAAAFRERLAQAEAMARQEQVQY